MDIGVIQLTSVLDFNINLCKIRKFLKEASNKKLQAVYLPECFYSMSNGKDKTPYLIEFEKSHYENIRSLAKDFNLYILGGSAATLFKGEIVNRVYNFGPDGRDLGSYDKIHLFSCHLKKNGKIKKIDEADLYTPGNKSKLLEVENERIGLGVCFDLRFSDMSLAYRRAGASILTFSSAFTVPTGRAHWHILNRARAIENQCFVISAAQWGKNNEKISTFGHSLIIDPWGNILADAEEGEKLITAHLDFSMIGEVRDSVIMNL